MAGNENHITDFEEFSGLTVNAHCLGQILGVTEQRIWQLSREGHLEKIGHGTYALADSFRAYVRYLHNGGQRQERHIDAAAEKSRLLKEQADKAALDNAARRGELVPVTEVLSQWDAMMVFLKSRIMALPGRITPQILAAKLEYEAVHSAIKAAVHHALEQLSGYDIKSIAGETATAANADRIGMGGHEAEVKPGSVGGTGAMEH